MTDGTVLQSGGVLLARNFGAPEVVLRGGAALIDWVDAENMQIILSGGAGYFACALPAGTHIEGGAGTLTAQDLSQSDIAEYGAEILAGDAAESRYYQTTFSPDWLPEGADYDSLTLLETPAGYFAGTLRLENAALTVSGELRADGAVSIERGRVEITDGTVYLAEGLWLGEGDVVVSGGEVIVPGGLDALCCDHGEVLVTGGTDREP